jgi:hypothetical protein
MRTSNPWPLVGRGFFFGPGETPCSNNKICCTLS